MTTNKKLIKLWPYSFFLGSVYFGCLLITSIINVSLPKFGSGPFITFSFCIFSGLLTVQQFYRRHQRLLSWSEITRIQISVLAVNLILGLRDFSKNHSLEVVLNHLGSDIIILAMISLGFFIGRKIIQKKIKHITAKTERDQITTNNKPIKLWPYSILLCIVICGLGLTWSCMSMYFKNLTPIQGILTWYTLSALWTIQRFYRRHQRLFTWSEIMYIQIPALVITLLACSYYFFKNPTLFSALINLSALVMLFGAMCLGFFIGTMVIKKRMKRLADKAS